MRSRPIGPPRLTPSKLVIHAAIAANVAIAVTKRVVAGITGGPAMLSQGTHSSVGSFNGVLLLVGIRLSQRPATPEHPFGHGKALYLWSLIVAVLTVGLGGGAAAQRWSRPDGNRAAPDPDPQAQPVSAVQAPTTP